MLFCCGNANWIFHGLLIMKCTSCQRTYQIVEVKCKDRVRQDYSQIGLKLVEVSEPRAYIGLTSAQIQRMRFDALPLVRVEGNRVMRQYLEEINSPNPCEPSTSSQPME